ncbi:MAG: hypothetical protein ACYYK0_05965 [Candidatus Eutrophobiaceae bacterium]
MLTCPLHARWQTLTDLAIFENSSKPHNIRHSAQTHPNAFSTDCATGAGLYRHAQRNATNCIDQIIIF